MHFYAFFKHSCFVSQEWEDLVKTQPDGTVKRFRRRIIVVQFVKGDGSAVKRPEFEQEDEEEPITREEVEVDENSPDFDQLLEDPVSFIILKHIIINTRFLSGSRGLHAYEERI